MSLLDDLDALNEGHPVGQVPDEVTARWLVTEANSQVQGNLVKVNEGRELAARVDAAPYGQGKLEIAAWAARMGRSERLVRSRLSLGRGVVAALEEAGTAAAQLDSRTALNCPVDQVVDSVREALGLPELEKRKRAESPPPSAGEVADGWRDEGLGHLETIDPELMIAAAEAVIAAARERLRTGDLAAPAAEEPQPSVRRADEERAPPGDVRTEVSEPPHDGEPDRAASPDHDTRDGEGGRRRREGRRGRGRAPQGS